MGKALRLVCLFGVLVLAATARSDVATDPTDAAAAPSVSEPITGTSVQPATGDATTQRDPFNEPFDHGGADAEWPYSGLTPEEQAVVDRGKDTTGWQEVHDAYASAVREQSQRARAEA